MQEYMCGEQTAMLVDDAQMKRVWKIDEAVLGYTTAVVAETEVQGIKWRVVACPLPWTPLAKADM